MNRHLSEAIESDKERLREVDTKIRAITESNRQYQPMPGSVSRTVPTAFQEVRRGPLSHPLFDAALMRWSPCSRTSLYRFPPPGQAFGSDTTELSSCTKCRRSGSSSTASAVSLSPGATRGMHSLGEEGQQPSQSPSADQAGSTANSREGSVCAGEGTLQSGRDPRSGIQQERGR